MKKSMVILLLSSSCSNASELVAACTIGAHRTSKVEVVRDSIIANTHIYYLRENGKTRPFFGKKTDSRGAEVQVVCAGKRRRALLVTGEFNANAVQGFVLTQNGHTGTIERLDFAEKSRPLWLYLGPKHITVVIPTLGYGETSGKYIQYRLTIGSAEEPDISAVPQLPKNRGDEAIRLTKTKP